MIFGKNMLVTFRPFFHSLTFLENYPPISEISISKNKKGCRKLSGMCTMLELF